MNKKLCNAVMCIVNWIRQVLFNLPINSFTCICIQCSRSHTHTRNHMLTVYTHPPPPHYSQWFDCMWRNFPIVDHHASATIQFINYVASMRACACASRMRLQCVEWIHLAFHIHKWISENKLWFEWEKTHATRRIWSKQTWGRDWFIPCCIHIAIHMN